MYSIVCSAVSVFLVFLLGGLSANAQVQQLELELSNGTYTGKTILLFTESGSTEVDAYDAVHLGSLADDYTEIYSRDTLNNRNLSINNLPDSLSGLLNIPLYTNSTLSGIYTLSASKYENLPLDWRFTLYDTVTEESIILTENTSFTISVNSGNVERFILSIKEIPGFNKISGSPFPNTDFNYASWADLDKDGDLDLIHGGSGSSVSETAIYFNDGTGGLTKSSNSYSYANAGVLGTADYNGDGYIDFLTSGLFASGTVYLNNGDSTFSSKTIPGFNDYFFSPLHSADLDNDGDIDFILKEIIGINDGAANFTISTLDQPTFTGDQLGDIEIGDFNQDGYVDLLISGDNSGSPFLELYWNDGNADFTNSGMSFTNTGLNRISVIDIDNDGDLDFFGAGEINYLNNGQNDSTNVFMFLNTGNSFTESKIEINAVDFEILDFNGDGGIDFLTKVSGSLTVYENIGEMNFIPIYNEPSDGNWFGTYMLPADFDSDSDPDIFITGSGNESDNSYMIENKLNESVQPLPQPTNLTHSIKGNALTLTWGSINDPSGGSVIYDVFLKNVENSGFILPAYSAISSGARGISGKSNAGINTFYKIKTDSLQPGIYQWGVRAGNQMLNSSEFSNQLIPLGSFLSVEDDTLVAYSDTSYSFIPDFFNIASFISDSTLYFSIDGNYSGIFYLDENTNNQFEPGELQVADSSLVSYSILSEKPLKFLPSENRPMSIIVTMQTNDQITKDSVAIRFTVIEGAPELQGNSDQSEWYLLSNPQNTTLGELFDAIWTQGAPGSDAPSGSPTLYLFDVESLEYLPIISDLDTTKIPAGTGILTYIFADDNFNDSEDPVNGGWPKTLYNFGNPFGDHITIPIKNVDADSSGNTSDFEGLKLFGNPFGWPISVDSLISELVDIDPLANRYVYRWNPVDKRYELTGSGSINPYESVFIRTITFGVDDQMFLEIDDYYEETTPKIKTDQKLNFTLSNTKAEILSESSLLFKEESLPGIDPYDGYYLGSFASTFANLYTRIIDQPLTINSVPVKPEREFRYPIFLDATMAGEFHISWDSELIPSDIELYFEVNPSGDYVNLSETERLSISIDESKKITKWDSLVVGDGTPILKNPSKKASEVNQLLPVLWLIVSPGRSIDIENKLEIPTNVELEQNYPNPFNPSSVIRFGVPTQAPVQLEVYDVLGRKVMTLLNGEIKQPGRYNINFDGRTLASGMYVYRLVIGDKILTKKMTLIK
ncbi:MAG: T9SS type A sorting domain-containing protein [Balneolaceae bacterium]|nr:T9SS type A sorting domain-containing protein [Balneolaceae bacterium]